MGLYNGGERRATVYVIIARDNKLVLSSAGIGAERTALLAGALIDWQPDSAVRCNVNVAVQTSALGSNAVIRQDTRAVAGT